MYLRNKEFEERLKKILREHGTTPLLERAAMIPIGQFYRFHEETGGPSYGRERTARQNHAIERCFRDLGLPFGGVTFLSRSRSLFSPPWPEGEEKRRFLAALESPMLAELNDGDWSFAVHLERLYEPLPDALHKTLDALLDEAAPKALHPLDWSAGREEMSLALISAAIYGDKKLMEPLERMAHLLVPAVPLCRIDKPIEGHWILNSA